MNDLAPGALAAELTGTLHLIAGRLEAALEPLGLSLAKFGVLSKLVASQEPLPLRLLAEQCACVRSNITQLVDRLEDGPVAAPEQAPDEEAEVADDRLVAAGGGVAEGFHVSRCLHTCKYCTPATLANAQPV